MHQDRALEIMMRGDNIILTGPAGAGKSYLIDKFVKKARRHGKKVSITATTGIAASNIGGSTIHSWSGIGIGNKLHPDFVYTISDGRKKAINKIDVLIIDEVSMMNSYVIDMVNDAMKIIRESEEPFGGLQVILVGDFFQLPPVDKTGNGGFITESAAWKELNLTVCYLEEQHRTDDNRLQEILNRMREGTLRQKHMNWLMERWRITPPEDTTRLYTLNVDVDKENEKRLAEVPGDTQYYLRTYRGSNYEAIENLQRSVLAPQLLALKVGALVMAVKNDPAGDYANGSIGTVESFTDEGLPCVILQSGKRVVFTPQEWEARKNDKLLAAITQIPLRLAYAITVHKSQGMTLDAAEVDLSSAFAPGMGYVALSRVRTLGTLYIKGLNQRSLMVSDKAREIDKELREKSRSML